MTGCLRTRVLTRASRFRPCTPIALRPSSAQPVALNAAMREMSAAAAPTPGEFHPRPTCRNGAATPLLLVLIW